MNISAPFILRPIATALLMVGLLVGGLVSYPLLPVAALPNVNYPTLQITAQLPGADPQTMASSVATPLELQFGEIPGLTQMTSASALGYTQITLQFDLNRQIDGTVSDTLGDQCCYSLPPRGHAVSPDDPEGQSRRHTDPGAWPDLRHAAADHG
jgi:multidrug efflux pump subunit AcrB